MAAEFVACYEASSLGLWLRIFVTGLRILSGIERPLKLYVTINQQFYLPTTIGTTIGAHLGQNKLT